MLPIIEARPMTFLEKLAYDRSKLPKFIRPLSSLKTTAVLGGTLAALLNPAAALTTARTLIPTTPKGIIGASIGLPTAIGVLSSSPKARTTLKTALDPRESVQRGKRIGEIIEDPKQAEDILGIKKGQTLKEKIKAGAIAGGQAGAILAGGLAIGAAAKKAKDIIQKRRSEKVLQSQEIPSQVKQLGFTDPIPVGLGGIPVGVPQQITPSQPTSEPLKQQPIQNIIQIQIQ